MPGQNGSNLIIEADLSPDGGWGSSHQETNKQQQQALNASKYHSHIIAGKMDDGMPFSAGIDPGGGKRKRLNAWI